MEAVYINENFSSHTSLKKVVATFFTSNTPESTKVLFWKMFQCWVTRTCNIKSEISDEEIASFLDQLIDLVSACHALHQVNEAVGKDGHD
jgi:hypothetical protein